MRKMRRLTALGLAAGMVFSLAACGNSETPEKPQDSVPAEASAEGGGQESGKPSGTGNTYECLGQQGAATGDWNEYWLFDKIEEELGMNIDVTMVSIEGLQEKKNIGLASGEYPDFYFAGILSEDDIANYGAQGVFIPLEDYINEEYTPNLMRVFEEHPELKASLYYPDGHIYNITGMNASPIAANRFHEWINVEWAEKLNVPVPTTLDEFTEYLRAVKEGDPNGNGQADEIPLGGRYETAYFRNLTSILCAFGMTEDGFEAVDGQIRFNPAEPMYKEFLSYMNMLWTEGLMDPEYFTQSEEQYFAKQIQNQYGTFADYASWVRMYNEKDIWGQYDAWDPMTSEFNDKQIWPAYSVSPLGAFVITDKCEDPQDLMRLVDWFYDTEHSDWAIQGVPLGMWPDDPEIGWEKIPVEGGYEITHHWNEEEWADFQSFNHQKCTADYGTFPCIPSTDLMPAADDPQFILEDATAKHRVPFYNVGMPSFKYTSEEASEISLISVDVMDYAKQMFAKFVTGEESLDNFDAYVQGLKDRNLDRLIELQQQAYDRWAESN